MDKALMLPEILACIGNMLDNNNIISCMQVCKAWRTEFEPRLWRSFTLKQLEPDYVGLRPDLALLKKNAHHIRSLVIKQMDSALQDFFMRCKQLEEVRFDAQEVDDGDGVAQMWDRFSDMIDNHSRLRKIVIDTVPWPMTNKVLETMERCPKLIVLESKETELDVIAQILEAAPRIEKLSLPRTGFGELSMDALRRHFPTLRDINLQFCSKVTSPMVQEILRSCANLQSISAESLARSDIIQHPWACRNLQMFDVGIDFVDETDGYDPPKSHFREVYQRLSLLTELNYLSICSENQADTDSRDPIEVSLEAGLDELATLKKLTFFSCKTLLNNSHPSEG
ncbi:hypothetical protein BGZ91_009039, partial [Linnemannia elongata]